jgi:hypothetical protein
VDLAATLLDVVLVTNFVEALVEEDEDVDEGLALELLALLVLLAVVAAHAAFCFASSSPFLPWKKLAIFFPNPTSPFLIPSKNPATPVAFFVGAGQLAVLVLLG